jgi:hypothetical protein
MPSSNYDDNLVYRLKSRLWAEAYRFAKEQNGNSISGLELLTALHMMIEETHHHWIEDKKKWNNILQSKY